MLVIESGEIQLPGDVSMKNIGLPKGVAYACLAETIVLALEGRFENFTVGRAIEWEKVREIYRLGLKHGMKLAAISGVHGVLTDDDIARVRKLALAARARAARRRRTPRERRRDRRRASAPRRAPRRRAKRMKALTGLDGAFLHLERPRRRCTSARCTCSICRRATAATSTPTSSGR